jgi:acetylornithine deacetylase/succinyl-diaminopimelate desuccinylase-like protein
MERSLRIDNNETISVLKKLVSIKSVNPDIESGEGEIEVSNFIAEYLKKIGLEVHTQEVKEEVLCSTDTPTLLAFAT